MRFRGLDLNLLVALDALLDERSVTAAGRKLHLSQSATSSALGRLRRHFGDRLLVSVGRHMELTPYGAKLSGAVRAILLQIDASLKSPADFDPRTSARRFTIAASDYAINVLLLEVQRRCARLAPHIGLEIMPVLDSALNALHRGEIDLLILPDRYRLEACPSEVLFEDRLVCVAARGNREVSGSLTLEAFKRADHVTFQPDPGHVIAFDAWLRQHYSFSPSVKLALPSYSLLPFGVVGTMRIATIPARLARLYAATLPIRIVEPAFPMPPMIEILQWHAAHADDAGLRWLRSVIDEVANDRRRDDAAQQRPAGAARRLRSARARPPRGVKPS